MNGNIALHMKILVCLCLGLSLASKNLHQKWSTVSLGTGESVIIDESLGCVVCDVISYGAPFHTIPGGSVYTSSTTLGLCGRYGIRNAASWYVTSTIDVTCH